MRLSSDSRPKVLSPYPLPRTRILPAPLGSSSPALSPTLQPSRTSTESLCSSLLTTKPDSTMALIHGPRVSLTCSLPPTPKGMSETTCYTRTPTKLSKFSTFFVNGKNCKLVLACAIDSFFHPCSDRWMHLRQRREREIRLRPGTPDRLAHLDSFTSANLVGCSTRDRVLQDERCDQGNHWRCACFHEVSSLSG